MTASRRYALYLAPPADSALWRLGSAVLGYDAETGRDPAPPELAGFDAETWHDVTAEPRRYGFHGTLKAPFRLADGVGEEDMLALVSACAREHHPFELPPLAVRALGAFIALVLPVPVPALMELAACAVTAVDPARAPLTPAEIARRRPERLSARQRGYLEAYGYPYVLDEFRFHMTLTGPLGEAERGHALNALAQAYSASGAEVPVTIADVGLYVQEAPQERFRLVRRIPLGA